MPNANQLITLGFKPSVTPEEIHLRALQHTLATAQGIQQRASLNHDKIEAEQVGSIADFEAIETQELQLQAQLRETSLQLGEIKTEHDQCLHSQAMVSQKYQQQDIRFKTLWDKHFLLPELANGFNINQITAVLNIERLNHTQRLEAQTKHTDEVTNRLALIIRVLRCEPKKPNTIPFKRIFELSNHDELFFNDLLKVQVPHSNTNSRALGYYYQRQKELLSSSVSKDEYDLALKHLIAAIDSRLVTVRTTNQHKVSSIQSKLADVETMQTLAGQMDNHLEHQARLAVQLQQLQLQLDELQTRIESIQKKQADLLQKKQNLQPRISVQSQIKEHLLRMNQILEKDTLALSDQSLKPTSIHSWQNWDNLRGKHPLLLEEFKGSVPQGHDSHLEQELLELDLQVKSYLLSSLDTSFAHFQVLCRPVELLGLSSFKTAADFDAFLLQLNHLEIVLKEVQRHSEACIALLSPAVDEAEQAKLDDFRKQSASAKASYHDIALLGSSNLGALIKELRQDIQNTGLTKSSESLQKFKRAQSNLDSLYACPYSLFEFLSLSEPNWSWTDFAGTPDAYIDGSMQEYQHQLVRIEAIAARQVFADALIMKHAIETKDFKSTLDGFVLSGNMTPVFEYIETALAQKPKAGMQTTLHRMNVEFYEYERNFNTSAFQVKGLEFDYSCYSIGIKLQQQGLTQLQHQDRRFHRILTDLNAEITNMKDYANALDQVFRQRDASNYRALADKFQSDVNYFMMKHLDNPPKEKDYKALKSLLLSRVHSENKDLGNHFKKWKPILINALIAVFALPILAIKLGVSYLKTGQCSFFYEKTQRQERLSQFEKTALAIPSN